MSRTTAGPAVLVALLAALAVPTGASAEGWIVSATPSAATARLAAQHGARPLRLRGNYVTRDRALAAALRARGLLRRVERDVALARASAYEADPGGYARGTVVAPGLTPPSAFAPIGLVDDVVDTAVPDVAQARVLKASPGQALDLVAGARACANTKAAREAAACPAHGTEVASVAAGRADGQGVIGVAPGAPLLSFGYKTLSCAEVSDGVLALADAGAKVINLSFEATKNCSALRLAVAAAYGEGAVVVASSGNDRLAQDPVVYPAAYPHVLTVGALDLGLQPAGFSGSASAVDLVAPGESIPVALPPALDGDGTADGLTRVDGTSIAAPMVSGAASWLIAARPGLVASQYADLLRAGAKDVGAAGWDDRTGFGLVDLAAALTAPVPPADRGEPNDDMAYADGTDFDQPDPYIYRGGAARTVTATAAPSEDPADVYRIRVKGRGRAVARLSQTGGLTLSVYAGSAKSLKATPVTRGGRTLRIRNPINKTKTYYVVVRAATAAPSRPALPYTLKVGSR
jgi:hypothetical protein